MCNDDPIVIGKTAADTLKNESEANHVWLDGDEKRFLLSVEDRAKPRAEGQIVIL